MSHYYFLSTEVGDKNNCNSEATEWRLTRASGVTCLFSIHPQTPWHLLAQSYCVRHWKEQRNESRATILMGHNFCQPRWVTKIIVTAKRRNGDLLECLEWCIVFQTFTKPHGTFITDFVRFKTAMSSEPSRERRFWWVIIFVNRGGWQKCASHCS